MRQRVIIAPAAALLICLLPAAGLALTPYMQDFEGYAPPAEDTLLGDGWLVYGNVYDAEGAWLYGYGSEPAPNTGAAFCAVAIGEGGEDQGAQQLSVYSDYNNVDHGTDRIIESNVFQEQTIGPDDVGKRWVFDFQAKMGNLTGSSTAAAFIKTLDPSDGWAQTNLVTMDMTSIPTTWDGGSLSIPLDAGLEGQVLQFGFMNTATNYESSGIIYDNVDFHVSYLIDVPDGSVAMGTTLRQNYPNPFNPMTRIDFATDRSGPVDISVFDLAGRRVATVFQGELGAGEHHVIWNGRTDSGNPAAAGQYRYLLKTPTEQISRSMVLLK